MNSSRNIALVDELTSQTAEAPWLEFKRDNSDPALVGKLVSALSNAARLEGRESAFLVWGVEDGAREIVGTSFKPFTKKVGNQGLHLWLQQKLKPAPVLEFKEVNHPLGRVVLLEISAPTMAPVTFNDIPYDRLGSATPKLTDNPQRYQRLIERIRPYSWETGAGAGYVSGKEALGMLDYAAYFALTGQRQPEEPGGILEKLRADRLIERDVGEKWNITNLGAILFAVDLSMFTGGLARKGVRFTRYDGVDRTATVTHRKDERRGYAAGFEDLLAYINGLIPRNERIGQALREARPLFPSLAVRELIANALIHQDMTVTGAGPGIELFVDRMEISNPGAPLIEPDRMLDLPPRSRNEALASLMRRMGMCEEQGSGLDKAFNEVEHWRIPPPLLKSSDAAMRVVLYGPRAFGDMDMEERIRVCYFHAVLAFLGGKRMKNKSLCARFGIAPRNAAQASAVIKAAMEKGLIKHADGTRPRAGYYPQWA